MRDIGILRGDFYDYQQTP